MKKTDHYCYRCKKNTRSKFTMSRKLDIGTNERVASLECVICSVVKWGGRFHKFEEDK